MVGSLLGPAEAQTLTLFAPDADSPLSFTGELGRPSSFFLGLFLGIILTAATYLFFIWAALRDRGQVLLILLLLCLGFNIASGSDLFMEWVGIHQGVIRHLIQDYSMILAYLSGLLFTYYFLDIEANLPTWRWVFLAAEGVLVLLLLTLPVLPSLARLTLPIVGTLIVSFLLINALATLQRGVSGSLTHLIAFSFFLLGILAESFYTMGLFASLDIARHLSYILFSLAAVTFALVIAGQFAGRQEEREHALALVNERLTLAARGSNEGLFDWNLVTNEVFFSDQFARILGVPLNQGLGGLKTWGRRILPADRHVVFKSLRRLRESSQTGALSMEYRLKNPHSSEPPLWVHMKTVAARDPVTSRVIRFVGSIGDITARKRSESALRASEARFRSITEAHPVPVLIIRLSDQQIIYASPGAEHLLSMPYGTLMAHRLRRLLPSAEERQEILLMMGRGEEINLRELNVIRGDGEALPAALSARRVLYGGEPAMVMGLYDLTERRKAEAHIAQQEAALQQSEKMAALGGLLAGVAHELNNPLSVVVGQATLLSEGAPDSKTLSRAQAIFKAADRCTRIVKSFLAIARRKPPERRPLNVNTSLQAALDLLGYQFRNANLVVTTHLAPNLPNVMGDSDQLTQVFMNLALNAAQAMHEWPKERTLTIATEQKGSDVRITFRDTGPGVHPDLHQKVFEPFFSTKGPQGGTGVGLSLCLNIVEGHGGSLTLDETPGGGATFLISLPINVPSAEQTAETEVEAEERSEAVTSALPSPSSAARASRAPRTSPALKILVVDDEPELAQTLADLLAPLGHRVTLASDGREALDILATTPHDAIISDLRMPRLDGPTLYKELQKTKPTYCDRILYVTGDTLSTHVQEFLRTHDVPVIEKPYKIRDIKRALARLPGLRKPSAAV